MHSVDLPVSPEIVAEFGAEYIREAEALRARVHARSASSESQSSEPSAASQRATTNRANAQHSTGPRTVEGKQRSAANSFKHGLYSKAVVTASEDPAEFDALCEDLRTEHQPVGPTEAILVQELADQVWRLRRARALESWAWEQSMRDNHLNVTLLQLVQRNMSAAERGFHRALTALTKLQKERGFVPSKTAAATEKTTTAHQPEPAPGFVPTKSNQHASHVVPDDHATPIEPVQQAASAAKPSTRNGHNPSPIPR